jgi:type IV pilus assembly protein PilB
MLNNRQLDEWLVEPSGPANVVAVRPDSDHRELSDIWQPEDPQGSGPGLSLEEKLRQSGALTTEQMEQARKIHQKTPRKLMGQILLEMGVVTEDQLLECLAHQYELPFIHITMDMVNPAVQNILDNGFIESHHILPLGFEDGKLSVATSDPTNVFLLDEVQRKAGKPLAVKVCSSNDIRRVLQSRKDRTGDFKLDEIIDDIQDDDVEIVATKEEDIADLERAAGDSPIIKFVNYIIYNAVKEGASDIHIEPGDKKLKVRSRIDGVLFEMVSPPYAMHPAIVSRIKIMANMDIAERRLPQDGRIRVMVNGRDIDMRVSTLPTTHGEKVVIRILSDGSSRLTLTDLGMEAETLAVLSHQVDQPHGIILVTGPTGSGKSTTLFSALRTMDVKQLNISTVEDPVEYQMEGVAQVQVHEHIGMTFAAALRSLLRQDPDVILVGEIRDEETARIAVQASLTGHLVLSTLHTNDAPSSITRLINIGVEPYLIAASTNAVLAQRLVRRVCKHCQQTYEPDAQYAGFMKMYGFAAEKLIRGVGCEHCRHTGFQGRIGLFELLSLDDTYRDIITKSPSVTELRRLCRERGMVTLRDDGFRKVQSGQTTIDEVMKATESTI